MSVSKETSLANTPEKAPVSDTRSALEKMKGGMKVEDVVKGKINQLKEKVGKKLGKEKMDKLKEVWKEHGKVITVGLLGMIFKKKADSKERPDKHVHVTQNEPTYTEDHVTDVEAPPSKNTPRNRPTKRLGEIAQDHEHNAEILAVLPKNKVVLKKFLEKFEANKAKYNKVGEAANLPPILVAAIHRNESGNMNFDSYLHNGEKLGKLTVKVPKGVLFAKGEWEAAAIHALGGNIQDNNGRESNKYAKSLREKIGLSSSTEDVGKIFAFAEAYNGLGYRNKGQRSSYIYAGTNLMEAGRFTADGKYNPDETSSGIGVAAFIMAGMGEPRFASNNEAWKEYIVNPSDQETSSKHLARVLKYLPTDEAKELFKKMNPNEDLVTVRRLENGRKFELKESVAKGLALANRIANSEGYEIKASSAYRSPQTQAGIKSGHRKSNKWVAGVGKSWHQSGGAVDLYLTKIGSNKKLTPTRSRDIKKNDLHANLLEKFMNSAGFVRYNAEPWHFEIGSEGWYEIMKEKGYIDPNTRMADITYKRDQMGEHSHHHHSDAAIA